MPQEKEGIMKYESVLPADFNGVFHFTNWSKEDFAGVWGGVEYHFPALSTSPMVMPFSPLEIQNIRKKFAKDLAEREFGKSKEYTTMRKQEGTPGNRTMNSIHQAATYSLDTLAPFIKKALEPLPVSKAITRTAPRQSVEDKVHRSPKGKPITEAVGDDSDLVRMAQG